jgi:hypothetical protein
MKYMSNRSHKNREQGLTLIEVLVVSPLVVLLIGIFIGYMVSLTGDGLLRRENNNVTYEVNTALNDIELYATKATKFLSSTGTTPSNQGNTGTTAWEYKKTGDPDVLMIESIATTKSPLDRDREVVYKDNDPNPCASPNVNKNGFYPIQTVYFLKDTTLWKRTITRIDSSPSICGTVWQQASCASASVGTGPCAVEDEKLLENVTAVTVNYFNAPTSTTPLLANQVEATASTLSVTLQVQRNIAGKTIEYQASTRVKSENIN